MLRWLVDSISYKLQVATFAPWIKCIKENAEAGHSHMDVDRNCYYTIKQFDAVPFNFKEKVNVVRPPQKREDKCDPKKAKKNFWYLLKNKICDGAYQFICF